jgi:hypothetical protein
MKVEGRAWLRLAQPQQREGDDRVFSLERVLM